MNPKIAYDTNTNNTINKLVENYPNSNVIVTEKLVEVLGHTPFQVLVGAVIGILVGTLYGIF